MEFAFFLLFFLNDYWSQWLCNVAKKTHNDLSCSGNDETESSKRYLVLLVLRSVAVVQVLCCPHKEVLVTQWGAVRAEHGLGQKVRGQMEFWVICLRPCSNVCHVSICRLVFGTLYPAYYSYKAVKTKNVKEYVSGCVNVFAVRLSLHAGVYPACIQINLWWKASRFGRSHLVLVSVSAFFSSFSFLCLEQIFSHNVNHCLYYTIVLSITQKETKAV